MFQRTFALALVLALCLTAPLVTPDACWAQDAEPHGGMLRYPDISADHLVFVYANDLWVAERGSWVATPLASPAGAERHPKFSPDGSEIAFVGNYDGDRDLYTVGVNGGVPRRVTHHPTNEQFWDWTADNRLIFSSNGMGGLNRQVRLFTVSPQGGLPEKLPVPYGAHGAISADSEWLAYTPHSRQNRTWKRYRGGMATDIWIFHLEEHTSRLATTWEGTDSVPMWHDGQLYYLSDAGKHHRLNIWRFNPRTGDREQLTDFPNYDVKWPSVGPGRRGDGEIVFQNGAGLYLLNLSNRSVNELKIRLRGERPRLRPRPVDVTTQITSWNISPSGKRAVIEARGDIWTLPAKHGSPRALTRSDGAAERDPSWSPDGQWVAFFSDRTGEYQLYVVQSDGKGDPRQLTTDGSNFLFFPEWSPNSKHIAYCDKTGRMYVHTIESGQTRHYATEPWGAEPRVSWSHDSRWLTYVMRGENQNPAVWIFGLEAGEPVQVTSGMFPATWPTFDREGKYLYYASNLEVSEPIYDDFGSNWAYTQSDRLLLVPLRKDVESPFLPKSDEEDWGDDDDEEDGDEDEENDEDEADDEQGSADKDDGDDDDDEPEPLVIDLEGFEERSVLLPVKRGAFTWLAITDDHKLTYVRLAAPGSDAKPAVKLFDPADDKREEKQVLDDVGNLRMSADGKKLLVRKGHSFHIVDAKPDQKLGDALPTHGMERTVAPAAEWAQIFTEAWRIQRDWFYDPTMHGVNWKQVHDMYARMLPDCASREDLSYLIGEMIGEMNVGHAYYWGGDHEDQPSKSVGLLGCDFELVTGESGSAAYRIQRIVHAAPWDVDGRGPLSQPGVDVNESDYLLAVNGKPVDTTRDPWAAFVSLAGHAVPITVSEKPVLDDDARTVVVETLSNDSSLRYRAWVEQQRAYVEERTDGRVGYAYVPNTGVDGQNELVRQFYGQRDCEALIIDERWNGGGQIPDRFIELLNRPVTNYWAVRDGHDWRWPRDSIQGPKCMLINGRAGSGGDMFPALFRQKGLGKLIGRRTWGGLVGIQGYPQLIDGGYTTAPTFAYYETDGTWGIEGHGVDPDIEVIDDPALMVNGGDPQLDAAIKLMLEELERAPHRDPERPRYPDRTGMGIPVEDQ